ncbi:hypothetical protein ACPC54_01395 [Kitasatospora sp. NPDC094028]
MPGEITGGIAVAGAATALVALAIAVPLHAAGSVRANQGHFLKSAVVQADQGHDLAPVAEPQAEGSGRAAS